MKKVMLTAVVAFAVVCGAYAADEAKADAKVVAPAVKADATCPMAAAKAEAKVCEACAKLAKDVKAGEQAKPCDACTKKCEVKADAKAPEAKK